MITTEHDIIHYVESLQDESLQGYTPFKIHHVMELYKIEGKKSLISTESVVFRENLKYCVYSPVEQRYYLRHTKLPLERESVSERLSGHIKDKNTWVLFSGEDIEDMDSLLRRLHKFYYKEEGKMDYKVYIRLMITVLAKEKFINFNRSSLAYKSTVAQYDRLIKEILTNT